MGVYGPQTQVKSLLKGFVLANVKDHINIFLDEISALSV